mmetsp:Transcript_102835/g.160427  ORF Transcript_102835/g.160427 Transcript_102835/m.160427 type:complete len:206 (+) Transcript_102835:403-1020(+)
MAYDLSVSAAGNCKCWPLWTAACDEFSARYSVASCSLKYGTCIADPFGSIDDFSDDSTHLFGINAHSFDESCSSFSAHVYDRPISFIGGPSWVSKWWLVTPEFDSGVASDHISSSCFGSGWLVAHIIETDRNIDGISQKIVWVEFCPSVCDAFSSVDSRCDSSDRGSNDDVIDAITSGSCEFITVDLCCAIEHIPIDLFSFNVFN